MTMESTSSHDDLLAEARSWAGQVRAAMFRLTLAQRVALRLVYFERLGRHQAAERTNVSRSEFDTQLAVAMQALASELLIEPDLTR